MTPVERDAARADLAAKFSRFDADPEAVAWARAGVMREVERVEKFAATALKRGDSEASARWRRFANLLRMSFIGGEGCVIATFDERRPTLVRAIGVTS